MLHWTQKSQVLKYGWSGLQTTLPIKYKDPNYPYRIAPALQTCASCQMDLTFPCLVPIQPPTREELATYVWGLEPLGFDPSTPALQRQCSSD